MRYLPLTDEDRRHMLSHIGVTDVEALFADIPENKRLKNTVNLPLHKSELEVERMLSQMAAQNTPASSVPFFVGAGAYKHHVPASVDHLIQRSEFLTSYTPYQPEIAQGTLQYLFEFQTQVCELTGMDVANASMYDGSTATSEAVLMARRITKRPKAILSGGLHPHYRAVVQTVEHFAENNLSALPADPHLQENLVAQIDDATACVVVQSPSFYGHIIDLEPLAAACQAKGALLIVVVTEALSFGAIKSPGSQGADIVVAEGQSIGNGLNFGGPYVGLFATREKYVRHMPGRLCGQTVDANGRRSFVLTLSTREQHIRRDKATSNICTNSGLCALAFTIHMTLLGGKGLQKLALLNHSHAVDLAQRLAEVNGVRVLNETFFNEFTLSLPLPAVDVVERMADKGVLAGVPVSRLEPHNRAVDSLLLVANTEVNSPEDRATFVACLKEVLK